MLDDAWWHTAGAAEVPENATSPVTADDYAPYRTLARSVIMRAVEDVLGLHRTTTGKDCGAECLKARALRFFKGPVFEFWCLAGELDKSAVLASLDKQMSDQGRARAT